MKSSLAKNAAFNVLYNVLNVVFPLFSASYLARVLAPEGIGRVSYAQNIVSYFVMFAALGIPGYGTREIARLKNSTDETNKLFSELFLINFISTSVCVAAYYLVISLFFREHILLYAIFGLELFFNYINIDWFYRGREEYAYIAVRSILIKIISLGLLVLFVRTREDYIAYALISCLAIGGNYFFNVFHARRSVSLVFRGLELHRHLSPVLILMLSSVMASLYCKVDTTMLGAISTEEAVGFYSNAHKVVNIVLTLATAITAVFLPRLSYVYKNEQENYGKYLSKGFEIVFFLVLPCWIGLILVADELAFVLFGAAFAPAAETIRILAMLIAIKGIGDLLCYQAIISSGKERYLVNSRIVAGVTNVILNAILIPRYSYNGAAIASVISELVVNGAMLPYALSECRLKVSGRFVWTTVLATILMAVLVTAVRGMLNGEVVSLILSVLTGILVYVTVAAVLGNEMIRMVISSVKKDRSV